jgi:hypothetical protein
MEFGVPNQKISSAADILNGTRNLGSNTQSIGIKFPEFSLPHFLVLQLD